MQRWTAQQKQLKHDVLLFFDDTIIDYESYLIFDIRCQTHDRDHNIDYYRLVVAAAVAVE